MKKIRYVIAAVAVTALGTLLAPHAAHAADWGPPPGVITISCTELHMDPPSGVFVSYHIEINNDGVDRVVIVEAENDDAFAHIDNITSGLNGSIEVYATWNLGTGNGPTFTANLDCLPPPTSSTSTTTTTSTSTSTSTTVPASTTTTSFPCTDKTGHGFTFSGDPKVSDSCGNALPTTTTMIPPATQFRSSSTPAKELPFTGGATWPLVIVASLFIAAGLAIRRFTN
jgi:hypothetical protein